MRMNVNPTDIKVGIKAIKATKVKGILIETGSEEEINSLSLEINSKFGEGLEIIKHKLRKPRIIMYNVSKEITTENVVAIINAQNPGILTNRENMEAKFRYKNRKGRYNIVMEIGPQTRKQILQTKLKIGWEVCNVADYLILTRCYKCSEYNHKHNESRREETCLHCVRKHKMKEFTAEAGDHKYINYINCNKYNKER
jgi:hypothetical protein